MCVCITRLTAPPPSGKVRPFEGVYLTFLGSKLMFLVGMRKPTKTPPQAKTDGPRQRNINNFACKIGLIAKIIVTLLIDCRGLQRPGKASLTII